VAEEIMKDEQEVVNAIMLRNNIQKELAEIKTIEEAKTFVYKAKTFMQYVKTTKQNAEICFLATEQKIRGERICGKLIKEGQENGEIRTKGNEEGNNHIGNIKDINITKSPCKTLDEVGLNAYESMTFQQIASIPDEEFEEFIEEKRQNISDTINELTTAGIVRLAKSLNKEDKPQKERDINDVVDTMAKDLQGILNTFSQITDHWDSVDEKRREKLAIKLKRLISIFQSLQEKQKEKGNKEERKLRLLQITHEEEE